MDQDLNDLRAFATVARLGGFRDAARVLGKSASSLSDAVRRLELGLGTRLLNRTTRSVVPTEAGRDLLGRLEPALEEIRLALDVVNAHRDKPIGTLRLNVPTSATRTVLPAILPAFLAAYPDIRVEIIADENFVDILDSGCDAGIRYEERLAQDMIAVPIGPRVQRFALAASPDYLARRGTPQHPRDLLDHACIQGRFPSGVVFSWDFERDGEEVRIVPNGPLIVQAGAATELAIDVAIAGSGIIALFEDWLRPHLANGALVPVLEPWWTSFSGPFLYYPGRRLVPAPLRAFVDFLRTQRYDDSLVDLRTAADRPPS
ncbi:LysR family transcriptional regulator [Devosia sp. Leaf64]|jgi:DNA-binding transcriptional LysR family regulator|uniref:LysR family transcriptional regulator n=2 Tax=unclassified Devosia TaxID=196773 RepID=UPI000712416B|nr:LysR family transcriptional regulator [Devosia sp. Leaf64]KQN74843.1 LysR family transcriptional regulator [Devosia sp. Leaf64]